MSCNTCSRAFSLLRPEKGCPSCGFSYCSKCLNNKMFIKKLNSEKKVCAKCSRNRSDEANSLPPPDAFYRRYAKINNSPSTSKENSDPDNEILERLQRLKENNVKAKVTDTELNDHLQNLKEKVPNTTDAELYSRLAQVRGVPVDLLIKKPALPTPDLRTEQEQADDLLKQYMEQSQIDTKYTHGFKDTINNIESRLQTLKGASTTTSNTTSIQPSTEDHESEDEDTAIKKLIDKVKADVALEDNIFPNSNDELPFCEICNEDANVRCRGCKYLFCTRCFNEHKDDDDDCNSYDIYKSPKSSGYNN